MTHCCSFTIYLAIYLKYLFRNNLRVKFKIHLLIQLKGMIYWQIQLNLLIESSIETTIRVFSESGSSSVVENCLIK